MRHLTHAIDGLGCAQHTATDGARVVMFVAPPGCGVHACQGVWAVDVCGCRSLGSVRKCDSWMLRRHAALVFVVSHKCTTGTFFAGSTMPKTQDSFPDNPTDYWLTAVQVCQGAFQFSFPFANRTETDLGVTCKTSPLLGLGFPVVLKTHEKKPLQPSGNLNQRLCGHIFGC